MNNDVGEWQGARVSLAWHENTAVVRCYNANDGLMDADMESELLAVMDRVERRIGIRAVVLTGRDVGMFIRHYDVSVLQARAEAMRAREMSFSLDRPVPRAAIHQLIDRMQRSPIIFIAAINGTAMGGGFELALGCDLRVVQRGDYPIGLPEIRAGLLPGAGGTQAYAELLGTARALQLLLTGQVLDPEQAVALGLASACVPDVLAQALEMAARLDALPARACAHIKRLVRGRAGWTEEQALAAERTLFCDCMVDPQTQPLLEAVGQGHRRIQDLPPPAPPRPQPTRTPPSGTMS